MSFFDKALTGVLDGIERNVVDQVREAAAAALEEYPGQEAPTKAVQPADWSQAPQAITFWRLYDLEGKKQAFRDQLERVASEKSSKDKSAPSLIRRAEESESALLEICNLLLDAPDVVSYLCEGLSSQETIKELQKENKRLQKDTAAAEKEASTAVSVVSQVQRAEAERAALAGQLEEERGQVARLREEIAAQSDLQFQFTRQELELSQARAAVTTLQAEHQKVQNQLFELRSTRDSQAAAEADDAELAAHEHEAALTRIRELEHELSRTAAKLEQADKQRPAHAKSGDLQSQGSAVSQDARLMDELERAREAHGQAVQYAEELTARLRGAEADIAGLKEEVADRLSRQQTRELRERLQTAEALLDGTAAAEGALLGLEDESSAATPASGLVSALQGRNRQLVAENTGLRQRVAEAEKKVAGLEAQLQEAAELAQQHSAAIAQLEQDLLASSSQGGSAETQDGSAPDSHAGGMLQIVAGQRDRFRKRVEELEGELEGGRSALAGAEARAQALQEDNLSLYERIKYLQRYQAKRAAPDAFKVVTVDDAGVPAPFAGPRAHRMSCGPVQLQLGGQGGAIRSRGRGGRFSCFGGDDGEEESVAPQSALEQKYSEAYYSKINPFAEFQANERTGKLPAHERALLLGSKLLMASRAGRAFAVVYLVALHLFLFSLVYYIIIAAA